MFIAYAVLVTTQKDEKFIASKIAHIEKNMGFPKGFVTLMQNERDHEIPKRGTFNAHRKIYQTAVENNYEHTIIFQDDVYFLRPIKETEYASFLNTLSPENWDAFYLGHRCEIWEPRYIKKTETKGVVKVSTNDLHAYIISQPCAKKMAKLEWRGKGADALFNQETLGKNYALFPMVAIQSGKFGTPSFMNGVSERNAQYLRYITKKPFNIYDSIYYSIYLALNEASFFLSSIKIAFTHNHGKDE